MFIASVGLFLTLAGPPEQQLTVTLRGSLERSFVRAVPRRGAALAAEVARLLRWRGDVNRNVHAGDRVALVYSDVDGQEPELLGLQFMGLQLQLTAYRYTGADAIPRYYDARGGLVEPEMLNTPVPGTVQITELVQHGRGRRRHNGIDLKAPEGTPIRLPFPGVVRRLNWSVRINGHCIEVAYDTGLVGRFLHLQHVDPEVRAGARLPAGAALGTVGSTGHSNAAHLHYEVLRFGTPIEPLRVHGQRAVQLLETARVAFDAERLRLDQMMLSGVLPQPWVRDGQQCTPVALDAGRPLGCRP